MKTVLSWGAKLVISLVACLFSGSLLLWTTTVIIVMGLAILTVVYSGNMTSGGGMFGALMFVTVAQKVQDAINVISVSSPLEVPLLVFSIAHEIVTQPELISMEWEKLTDIFNTFGSLPWIKYRLLTKYSILLTVIISYLFFFIRGLLAPGFLMSLSRVLLDISEGLLFSIIIYSLIGMMATTKNEMDVTSVFWIGIFISGTIAAISLGIEHLASNEKKV